MALGCYVGIILHGDATSLHSKERMRRIFLDYGIRNLWAPRLPSNGLPTGFYCDHLALCAPSSSSDSASSSSSEVEMPCNDGEEAGADEETHATYDARGAACLVTFSRPKQHPGEFEELHDRRQEKRVLTRAPPGSPSPSSSSSASSAFSSIIIIISPVLHRSSDRVVDATEKTSFRK